MGRPKTPPSVTWVCRKCKQVVRTFIRLSDAPMCTNRGKHNPQKMEAQ